MERKGVTAAATTEDSGVFGRTFVRWQVLTPNFVL